MLIDELHAFGDITRDEVLYDAALRNLQTLSEATQLLPDNREAGNYDEQDNPGQTICN